MNQTITRWVITPVGMADYYFAGTHIGFLSISWSAVLYVSENVAKQALVLLEKKRKKEEPKSKRLCVRKIEFVHKWRLCELCQDNVVFCGYCNNNVCNGGSPYACPDQCWSAYELYLRG